MLEYASHGLTSLAIFTNPFRDDVTGTLNGSVYILHLSVNETLRLFPWVAVTLKHNNIGKWLKTMFSCHLSPCAPTRLIRQIQILQDLGVPSGINFRAQLIRHLILPLNGSNDCLLSFCQFLVFVIQLTDTRYLHLT